MSDLRDIAVLTTRVEAVVEAMRRGEPVIVTTGRDEAERSSSGPRCHVVLAVGGVSLPAIDGFLRLIADAPLFATTRSHLETVGVFESATGSVEAGGSAAARADDVSAAAQAGCVLAAATILTRGDRANRAALRPFAIHYADWGGVIGCEGVIESAVDLARLAGPVPVALVGVPTDAVTPAKLRHLSAVSIREIGAYRRWRANMAPVVGGPRIRLPTRHGDFTLRTYEDALTGQVHLAAWMGDLREPTLTRVHSECLTGDLLGSLRCDCGSQLDRALSRLSGERGGVLVYLRQEGRGIGLLNKLRAYALQDDGLDTVEANARIGFAPDLRDYEVAAHILKDLRISSIRLLTNNPRKVAGIEEHGIRIAERVPLLIEPVTENVAYLTAKRTKLGHWLTPC